MSTFWRKCSSCKKELGFGKPYVVCNVSTCNSKRKGFVFCSVNCWDAHLPIMNHRESWSVEKISPSLEAFNAESETQTQHSPTPSTPSTPKKETPMGSEQTVNENDVLVVASKMKAYVKAKSGMSTSADVMPTLSDKLRSLCDDAMVRARNSGRKTMMARDFE